MKFNLQSSEKRGQQCTPHELKNLVSTVLFTVFVTHLLKFIILRNFSEFQTGFCLKITPSRFYRLTDAVARDFIRSGVSLVKV